MAICKLNFRSKILGMYTDVNVILPELASAGVRPLSEMPVLTLLHGLTEDANAWLAHSSVERYAIARGICVVMPYGARSFYVDMAEGQRFYTFLHQELPLVLSRTFGLSQKREQNMIAGLSMGGYGAFRHALGDPDRFFAAGSFSGPLAIDSWMEVVAKVGGIQIYNTEFSHIFGKQVKGSPNDLSALLSGVPEGRLPLLYQSCGTEDPLLETNRLFASAAGNSVVYHEVPGGHDWDVWDGEIQKFMDFALSKRQIYRKD